MSSLFRAGLPMTEEDFLGIADIEARLELFDGSLYLSRPFTPRHQFVCRSVIDAPDVDPELTVLPGVAVRLRPGRIAVPDIVVAADVDFDQPFVEARSVRLVGEVLSTSTATVDQVLKKHYYAAAGIPLFLVVDPLTGALQLLDREGEASVGPGETLHLSDPVDVTLVPEDLLPPL